MSLSRIIPYVIILVLLLAMYHEGCKTQSVLTRSDTVVTYDTITKTVRTKPRIIEQWRTDTILDTVQVVQDYSTAKVYQDSIVSDTLGVFVHDTIQYNSIQGRSISYRLRLPTQTITNTITERKHVSGVYIGAFGSERSVGAQAVYVAPKWLGSVGYGTSGLHVGVAIRLGKIK